MRIAVLGAGAFGTALAISFVRSGCDVTLWGRDAQALAALRETRETPRLPGVVLPDALKISDAVPEMDIGLIAVPMQQVAGLVERYCAALRDRSLVACCKGLSLTSGAGPTSALEEITAHPAILTGPSFAVDIARGLPTALTLACASERLGATLQTALVADNLRLYRTTDVVGAEVGGALKNVVAIGCGAVMGAGLGASARAALMTRGFAEMMRFAKAVGARSETLHGLSGLGDLTLTCTSDLSRNYRLGHALGAGSGFDPTTTVEGASTARALAARAARDGISMPITDAIVALLDGRSDVASAMAELFARPMKEE
ncbi:NAD(P)H-dependent glycerol-3-phosphate dehydrogenase [Primorskyibacter sp. S187A]|uniref:NAD(P)H-dependent glycerol-3-phosphate dehydrogenase n=1 Tax=Primorskyibacter sp. S187A TaxID=3415130 RepID=UPI003C79960D